MNGAAFNNQTYYYPDMIMNGAQPIFTYDNDNNGYNYRTTSDIATAQRVGVWYEQARSNCRELRGNLLYCFHGRCLRRRNHGNLQINRDVNQAASVGAAAGDPDDVYELVNEDYVSRQLNRFHYPKLIAEGPANATAALYGGLRFAPSQNLLYFFSFQNTAIMRTI